MTPNPQSSSPRTDTRQTASPPPARGPRGLRAMIMDRFLAAGTIVETEPIAARMKRVRIGGPALERLDYTPGQQVRLLTGIDGRMGDPRTYSVWQADRAAGFLDLCVMDHGDGPGSRWGRAAEAGQEARFRGPTGTFTLREGAPYHLFAGEETAAVAFGAMLRAVPEGTPVYGAVETATEADRLPLPRADELSHPLRGDASAAASEILLAAVRALDLPDAPGIAYLGGEARTIQLIRKHLVQDRGWPRRAVLTKPFWTPGKRGLE
ncbi:NADPH-dependent ferric siderophore reductase [Nocardia transvalensis]|uniref:NADPH-dependent ferric siderophore reductase n=1 Tax=Nocardia transvalensis TaxID=37333 RepID=A0A7W9PHM6_9NOCA|nr:siderophore-interacting protein [Nocardia transvalensis]MBB5915883.1 NADPH-dependent ferric siderophore reductase [Nocardia transvalensis]